MYRAKGSAMDLYENKKWMDELLQQIEAEDRNRGYQYNDGGRSQSGRKGNAGDCVCRAIAIAMNRDYDEVYRELADANKAAGYKKSARNGIMRKVYEAYLNQHGWVWHSAPKFDGRKARHSDMPDGVVIVRMARHIACVIDGVVHDTWDSRRKMVYGYWAKV
jgi:hypothetical protein